MGRRVTGSSTFLTYAASPIFVNNGSDPRPLTFNLWYRPSSLGFTSVFANGEAGNPSVSLIIGGSGGELRFYSNAYGSVDTATGLLTVDVWNMLTVTWAGSDTYKLYVNGVLRATGTLALANRSSPRLSTIGALADDGTAPALGDYAEFAVWDSVLSDAQVASLYTGTESGLPATSVGSPAHYAPILGSASPEPETVGGSSWTVNGSMAASTIIGSSPAHPNISGAAPTAARALVGNAPGLTALTRNRLLGGR